MDFAQRMTPKVNFGAFSEISSFEPFFFSFQNFSHAAAFYFFEKNHKFSWKN
jgi:hypothetical protein